MARRVALTGVGIVSPIGIGKRDFWENLKSGRSGAGPIQAFDASGYRSTMAAEVKVFDVRRYLDAAAVARWTDQADRANQFMLVATQQALADADVQLDAEDRTRAGVSIGSAAGDLEARLPLLDDLFAAAARGDEAEAQRCARHVLTTFLGQVALSVNGMFGLQGDSTVTAAACASSTDAVGYAFRQIQYGEADLMIAGGAEAPIQPYIFYSYAMLNVLSQHNDEPECASRPFDCTRNGFVMGEGAGAILLEEWEHARRRGAHIYAEVAGYGASADAYHMTAPSPTSEQSARAMRLALHEAGVQPDEVDYVCAHGTSTQLNDVNETKTIKNVFGEAACRVPVSAIKSMLGHSQGAAGIMQAVTCALVMEHGFVPPTINYREPDPECDLDYVPNVGRAIPIRTILQNTISFFGRNNAVVYRKPVA